MEKITKAQWEAYRIVRRMGMYNMHSPEAVRDSGLDKDIYFSIMKHYNELEDKFERFNISKLNKELDDVDDE